MVVQIDNQIFGSSVSVHVACPGWLWMCDCMNCLYTWVHWQSEFPLTKHYIISSWWFLTFLFPWLVSYNKHICHRRPVVMSSYDFHQHGGVHQAECLPGGSGSAARIAKAVGREMAGAVGFVGRCEPRWCWEMMSSALAFLEKYREITINHGEPATFLENFLQIIWLTPNGKGVKAPTTMEGWCQAASLTSS